MIKTALIVDDSRLARHTLRLLLEKHGITVSQAQGVLEGEKIIFNQAIPDVVFMDVMMPELDGFEGLARLRKNPLTHALPVIMYSGDVSEEARRKAKENGATGYLPKPVEPERLNILVTALAKHVHHNEAQATAPQPVHEEPAVVVEKPEMPAAQETVHQAETVHESSQEALVEENITSDPSLDMPRERILRLGASALSDAELLAILLRTGVVGKPVLAFAQELIASRGGLVGLLTSRKEHLLPIKGIGQAKTAEILAVTELCKRFIAADLQLPEWQFSSADDVRNFLLMHYKGLGFEEVAILLLNQKNQYLAYERIGQAFGSEVSQVNISCRKLVKSVLDSDAAAVVLVHNHPAQSTELSESDLQTTKFIENFLKPLGVRLLDHFVVAGNQVISLRETGDW